MNSTCLGDGCGGGEEVSCRGRFDFKPRALCSKHLIHLGLDPVLIFWCVGLGQVGLSHGSEISTCFAGEGSSQHSAHDLVFVVV